ncbi:MAG: hypothetical protein HYW25_05950 [Candidatus Aenigmarchaeota archaeon]|nr:hypothetical protein [Candidatus Aenigmarchaeota archaeon]
MHHEYILILQLFKVLLGGASADRRFNPARANTTSGLSYTDAGVAADGNELVLYSVRGRNCNGEGN